MDIGTISIAVLLGMFILLAIGMPLGFASGFLAVAVLLMKFGPDLLFSNFGTGPFNILAQRMYGLCTDYVLISVPLFILMATLLERSGIARDMYDSLTVWLSRTRGGIAIVTSIMAIIMAAMSGIIGGEVVLLGLIALPQMLRLGYNQNLAIGTICASGSLGTMIPPSIVLIIYGLITETSIHALFKGAFVPGFILGGAYIIYIVVRTRLNPALAPLPEPNENDVEPIQKRNSSVALLLWIAGFLGGLVLVHAFMIEAQNALGLIRPDGYVPYTIGQLVIFAATTVIGLLGPRLAFGSDSVRATWAISKGLIAPLVVVTVVLGSIYGGVTGITEAAGMGTVAVLVLIVVRGEFSYALVRDG